MVHVCARICEQNLLTGQDQVTIARLKTGHSYLLFGPVSKSALFPNDRLTVFAVQDSTDASGTHVI